ncbi:hypothetical protein BDK51DRAFT_40914 [Blyttiomyces helicus]|uniref:F-box domain-containing protein n=1 Tax=Blyttiomyces helicus TaxID=388810 RepID=A0A4P9WHC2_9FUNG|nr:hypothetical protein BDK51DRAFT_40914 [Blyttiomyces helicus]|eukprot:RKO89926.1 hypothetical protein BDK51DRAFT_40914 [Blyttiomyces helicus]
MQTLDVDTEGKPAFRRRGEDSRGDRGEKTNSSADHQTHGRYKNSGKAAYGAEGGRERDWDCGDTDKVHPDEKSRHRGRMRPKLIIAAADAEEGSRSNAPRSLPNPRRLRLPTELLRQVFQALPDSRDRRSLCSDLRSTAVVCREWNPVASERLWTHVVVSSPHMVRSFTNTIGKGGASATKLATTVRTLKQEFFDWEAMDDFAGVVHRLEGLRLFATYWRVVDFPYPRQLTLFGPPISVVVTALLLSCPRLEVLSIPAPSLTPGSWGSDSDSDSDLDTERESDSDSDSNGDVDEDEDWDLTGLRVAGRRCSAGELWFQNLLLRSVGPLVELGLESDDPEHPLAVPDTEAITLPNLEIVEAKGCVTSLFPSLINIQHPLRRLVLAADSMLLLRLGFGTSDCGPMRQPIFTSNGLQHFLRVRGSNLTLLNIADNMFAVKDLLGCVTCIGQTAPLLETLILQTPRSGWHGDSFGLEKVAFLRDLKRGCPNLRHVELPVSYYRDSASHVSEEVLQLLADLKVDIYRISDP